MNNRGSTFNNLILFIVSFLLIVISASAVGSLFRKTAHSAGGEINSGGGNSDDENEGDGTGDGNGSVEEHEHNYTLIVTEPTCTEQGYTTYSCECGDEYVSEYVSATGHDWSAWTETLAPTCTVAGEKMRVCQTDSSHTETQRISPAHSFVDGLCSICAAEDPYYGATLGLAFTLNADEASYSCSGIGISTETDIVIPSEIGGLPVTAIMNSAFKDNTIITSVVIPDSVIVINSVAFSGCTALKSFIFSANLKSLYFSSFRSCENLEVLDFSKCTSIPSLNSGGLSASVFPKGKVVVPDELYDDWTKALNWSTLFATYVKASEYQA